jgi:NADH-quinone oxidoreductase subunit I
MAIGTKVVKQKELTFWEKIYLPEILRGILITSTHFARNLSLHTLHRFGLLKHLRAAVTFMYPEEKRPLALRLRTRHRLTQREDGSPRCVACMMCETICPARCIYIVAEEHPDPNIEKRPKSFDIDLGKCVYCGFCVEACPEDAIRMDTQIMNIASYTREGMFYNMDRLLHPEKDGDIVLSKNK